MSQAKDPGHPTWIGVEDVSQVYRSGAVVTALNHVSVDIARGEYVSLTGASGSGKSTLLHILCGLRTPTTGRRVLCGVENPSRGDVTRLLASRVAVIFQAFHLQPTLSALENVELGGLYGPLSAQARRRRAIDALERVGLADRLHHRPRELSGGEQQRVAIARATLNQPQVIFADEPTGNLDSVAGTLVLDLLDGQNRLGASIVLVTHDPGAAARAGRTIQLRDGRISASMPGPTPGSQGAP